MAILASSFSRDGEKNASVSTISKASSATPNRKHPPSVIAFVNFYAGTPSGPGHQWHPSFHEAPAGEVTHEGKVRLSWQQVSRKDIDVPVLQRSRYRSAEVRQHVVGSLRKHLPIGHAMNFGRAQPALHEADRLLARDAERNHVVRVLEHHVAKRG